MYGMRSSNEIPKKIHEKSKLHKMLKNKRRYKKGLFAIQLPNSGVRMGELQTIKTAFWGSWTLTMCLALLAGYYIIHTKETITTQPIQTITIGCASNSMGLLAGCNDKAIVEQYNQKEKLQEGQIYIFQYNTTTTAIHRFIKCMDDNCTTALFKGDNKYIGEIRERKKVYYKVIGIQFRG